MSTDLHPQYCPSQALVANYLAVPQKRPRSPPVTHGDSFLKMMQIKKTGERWQKAETESWGLAINEWRPKKSKKKI